MARSWGIHLSGIHSRDRHLKVVCIGGGPAGLYFAALMKKADPRHEVVVLERNAADDTFGWGVVFSDQTLEVFRRADAESYAAIVDSLAHWDDIDVHFRGRTITSGGHGFSGISRRRLLQILQDRARGLGADLRFGVEVANLADLDRHGLGGADLIVAADGVNSMVRRSLAEQFRPDIDVRPARYIWLGTTRRFDAFTFIFVQNECGVYQVHAYRFDQEQSAFIVECDEASWRNAGLDAMDADHTVRWCETTFAPWLQGHALLFNALHKKDRPWLQFARVANENWYHDNIVLIGDAAHTAHFSIGSGTKLAMEDAVALAREVNNNNKGDSGDSGDSGDRGDRGWLAAALARYQAERKTEALRLQNAARNSMEWFENSRRYMHLEPEQLVYSLLTRSQRVSHENLRLRDGAYLSGVERWFAQRSGAAAHPDSPPPMFTPYKLRGLTLPNRLVVAPMDMYSAVDGVPDDFHLVHLGARALGGAGLVFTEMTCVSPEGRITPRCAGMYTNAHTVAWARIVDFVHQWTPAKICLQLGHSGRKGSTKVMWEGQDEPLDEGNWPLLAPSAIPWSPRHQVPRAMTRDDMARVLEEHVRAVRMAIVAGFDMIELHAAHGYLLSSFITPLANRRDDEYGGSLANRLRYPLEVLRAMREAWPEERPMSVRISATDWAAGGVTGREAVEIAKAFHAAGADIIHVSTGQTTPDAKPVYGRMFQTPYSDMIRQEARVPTIAVGNITDFDQVNSILAAGRADLVALARPHLANPNWTQHAALEQGFAQQWWPVQYLRGREQLERLRMRAMEMRGSATI
ncbi:MAG TPA: bifunctional salicylyl-CoA 5-hydroxylase/oxidoreductase [Gemmatimonadales bacterium]|nr:bifunctional salicylyl-CoA 5-hydroxylase/oxidoreductase [Gemmatimonadales bacterium]